MTDGIADAEDLGRPRENASHASALPAGAAASPTDEPRQGESPTGPARPTRKHRPTTVYLHPGQPERLHALAEKTDRPAASHIRIAVEEYLARQEGGRVVANPLSEARPPRRTDVVEDNEVATEQPQKKAAIDLDDEPAGLLGDHDDDDFEAITAKLKAARRGYFSEAVPLERAGKATGSDE